jgi:hypothetical protein
MEADILAYIDELHEEATDERRTEALRTRSREEFCKLVFEEWPSISAILPEHDHSM